jgi:hypothetical protein
MPSLSVVAVVATTGVPVVVASTAVIPSGEVFGSSNIFPDELFYIVGVGVILGRGEKFGDGGWPLT